MPGIISSGVQAVGAIDFKEIDENATKTTFNTNANPYTILSATLNDILVHSLTLRKRDRGGFARSLDLPHIFDGVSIKFYLGNYGYGVNQEGIAEQAWSNKMYNLQDAGASLDECYPGMVFGPFLLRAGYSLRCDGASGNVEGSVIWRNL